MPKLTKEELEKKKKHYEKKVKYYDKKIKEVEADSKMIGFRYSQFK